MSIYIQETEEIYFPKTKEYFQEVISSYSNGNYRSAVVMLYSVAICDMLFKLQELKEMYNDTIAEGILKEVEKSRNEHDNKSKSRWEKEFVDNVYKKTEFLDLEAYTNLNHLYELRNFSAHPALNDNYELISPTKEMTIAYINAILKSILIKPPIFIKKVINTLTEDLKDKKSIFVGEYEKLSTYLKNKYYSRMSETMKQGVLKAFWKFCFCSSKDINCSENLVINRCALEILVGTFYDSALEYIQENLQFFHIESNEHSINTCIVFLSRYTRIYALLAEEDRLLIDKILNKYELFKSISWFKYDKLDNHLKMMEKINFTKTTVVLMNRIYSHYADNGMKNKILTFFVRLYGSSRCYDDADERFETSIEPYLDKMDSSHIVELIKTTNQNSQIWARSAAPKSNKIILQYAKQVLNQDFKYDDYPNFMNNIDDTPGVESIENLQDDEIPF
ncbi:MAG: hypothetical protein J6A95_05725 [Clostridia bacterium]|nr:hypothetical protein [Clostridia bacterium]